MEVSHLTKVRQLYKVILKLHSKLPEHIRGLGNTYARDEFRRHKNCNPTEASIFLEEWTKYAIVISQQIALKGPKKSQPLGQLLTKDQLDSMSEDQIYQLYRLMLAAQGKIEDENISEKKMS